MNNKIEEEPAPDRKQESQYVGLLQTIGKLKKTMCRTIFRNKVSAKVDNDLDLQHLLQSPMQIKVNHVHIHLHNPKHFHNNAPVSMQDTHFAGAMYDVTGNQNVNIGESGDGEEK